MGLQLRRGEPGGLHRLVEIYNYYVNETHNTFDTEPFAAASRTQWFNQFSDSGLDRTARRTWFHSCSLLP